jgi:hypothetical protein
MKSRLKKTQKTAKKLGESDSRFCICFDRLVSRAINLVYAGKSTDEIDFSALPKDFCRECDLPVNVEKIQSINQQIDLILPMYENPEIQMPSNVGQTSDGAAQMVQQDGLVPSGMISRAQVAARLEISPYDVERHLKSGRLVLDVSKKFITQESFDELKVLIRRTNG